MPSATASPADVVETVHQHVNTLKTFARLLQTDAMELRAQLERAEREGWDHKVRRADAAAKLKARDGLLAQIQQSVAWKIVKPIWKLFHRSRRHAEDTAFGSDLAFALELPRRWTTNRDVILIKGWCFSRSGKQIAGIRAKIGKKARLARYGLERRDVADSFRGYAAARQSGFTVEVKVPPGITAVQLEVIEQGSDWKPFFREELVRETNGPAPEPDEPVESKATERILTLPSLSASKAFELIEPGFQQHALRASSQSPFISVVTPTYNTKPEWLAEAALSLLNQTFADWEWCIVDDGSDNSETKKLLELLGNAGARVQVSSSSGKGISAATNRGVDLARGEYICFLDHDDLLHPEALQSIREKLQEGYDVVYSDEDKLEETSGALIEPFFKPDWSPEYFRGVMYVGHLLCVRRELAIRTRARIPPLMACRISSSCCA